MKFVDLLRQRAKWHLAHPRRGPDGARAARRARDRGDARRRSARRRAAQAADDLGALTKFARHPEAYLYTMWGWMVRGAGDPVRARELVAAHPESQRLVRELYLEDLARRGRVKQLTAAAQTLQGADLGALHLAIWGRPLAALELAATARLHTPELVCARALACYRAGRPDLTERILAEDLPPSEITDDDSLKPFPGPHEQWLIEHAPRVAAGDRRARGRHARAWSRSRSPRRTTRSPIAPSIEPIARSCAGSAAACRARRCISPASSSTSNKDAIAAAVEAAGARLVSGPFPGTDYYVHGDWCLVQTIAQLERQGARRLRRGELEGV